MPVHRGLERAEGIHLCDDHLCPHTLGTHRDTLSTATVAQNNDGTPGNEHIRRTQDAIEGRLSRPVVVIHEVLRLIVVHRDHGALEHTFLLHREQANDASRRFLASTDHF